MFYKSFYYEYLVNLYFKKKYFLEGSQREKYSFKNTQTNLVKSITKDDLNNLYISNVPIRLSTKYKNKFIYFQMNIFVLENPLKHTFS